jgi:UPF0288 family protein (methanogenesis marker protein 3)
MKPKSSIETVIICVAAVAVVAILTGNASDSGKATVFIAVAVVAGLGLVMGFRYLTARKQAQLELTGSEQYRRLAEEYRRLADMAITAQEHTDLKLGDVSAQLDYLREQNASLQKILKEVE